MLLCAASWVQDAAEIMLNEYGCADLESGQTAVLAGGHDFVAAPRLSPDGSQLAWVAWDHPNMPWDDTTLYLAQLQSDGSLTNIHKVGAILDILSVQCFWRCYISCPVSL